MPWWFDDTVLNLLQTILAACALMVAVLLGVGGLWLAKRQMDIARRQMEMQAEQHKFFSQELSKRPRVQLIVTGMLERIHEIKRDKRQVLLTVAAKNFGTKVADGFFWEIRFPENLSNVLSFADALWKPSGYGAEVANDTLFLVQKGFYDKKAVRKYSYRHRASPGSGE